MLQAVTQLYFFEMCIQLNEPTLKKDLLVEDTVLLFIHSFNESINLLFLNIAKLSTYYDQGSVLVTDYQTTWICPP